jgi:hypothetical protein
MEKKATWSENPDARQATKKDLVDIAHALGLDNINERLFSVPEIRASIRMRLIHMAEDAAKAAAAKRQPSLFESLNNVREALGAPLLPPLPPMQAPTREEMCGGASLNYRTALATERRQVVYPGTVAESHPADLDNPADRIAAEFISRERCSRCELSESSCLCDAPCAGCVADGYPHGPHCPAERT